MSDPVNHPQHYRTDSGLEAIEVIEAFFPNDYHLGNAFKYLARAGKKDDEVQDLKKAVWYINRRIESVKDDGAAFSVGDRVLCTGDALYGNIDGYGSVLEYDPSPSSYLVRVDNNKSTLWYRKDQLRRIDEDNAETLYDKVLDDLLKHAPLENYQDKDGNFCLTDSSWAKYVFTLNKHGFWECDRLGESFSHFEDLGRRLRYGTVVPGSPKQTFDPAAAAVGTVIEFEKDDRPWTKVKENCWRRYSNGLDWSDKEVQENVEEWTVTSITEPDYSNPPEGALGTIMDGLVTATFKNGAWAVGTLDVDPAFYGHGVTITEWPLSE